MWKRGAEGEKKVGCDGVEKRGEKRGEVDWALLQPVAYRHGVCPYAAVPSAYIGVCGVGECQTVLAEVVVVDVVE